MKRIIKVLSILFIFVLLFSFTSCSGSGDAKYKSLELNEDNIKLFTIDNEISKGQTVAPLASNIVEATGEKLIFIGYMSSLGTIYLNGAELPEGASKYTFGALYVKASAIDSEGKDYGFVGFLVTDSEDETPNLLYTNKSSIAYDKQKAIFVVKDEEGNVPFPTMAVDGTNFSGWYHDAEFRAGTRIANLADLSNVEGFNGVVYARYLSYGDAAIVSIICIVIVFLMLALLCLTVSLLKFINKMKKTEAKQEVATPLVATPKQPLKLEDIKDEDMMAAALVATIDYHEETKEDVRVVSIKEIK